MMKALTVWQPWASLLANRVKRFETRGWPTKYRGPIAIHAAARSTRSVLRECFPLGEWSYAPDYKAKREFLRAVGKAFEDYATIEDVEDYLDELPRGEIVAVAELVECWQVTASGDGWADMQSMSDPMLGQVIQGQPYEILFGGWEPGRYAWELAHVKRLDHPIPAKGRQGLWTWEVTR